MPAVSELVPQLGHQGADYLTQMNSIVRSLSDLRVEILGGEVANQYYYYEEEACNGSQYQYASIVQDKLLSDDEKMQN